mgnify:CR=1 FL=1
MSTADALRARLAKGAERSGRSSRELVARLALQLHLLKEGVRDDEPKQAQQDGQAIEGEVTSKTQAKDKSNTNV